MDRSDGQFSDWEIFEAKNVCEESGTRVITAARDQGGRHGHRYLIQVDGGIGPETAPRARGAGAEVFVAGNSVYRAKDPAAALDELRKAIQ